MYSVLGGKKVAGRKSVKTHRAFPSLPYSRAPFERGRHRGVRLVLLEGLERVQVRVLVVEPDHEAHRDQVVVGQVVQERPAVLRGLQRKRVSFVEEMSD